MFIFEGAFSGVWLAFIGWFLLQAAARRGALRGRPPGARRPARRRRDGARPGHRLARPPARGASWTRSCGRTGTPTYPVVENGRVVGLLPFRCVAEVPRAEWNGRTVRDCMLPLERVPLLEEDDELADALAELSENPVHRGLVLDDGRPRRPALAHRRRPRPRGPLRTQLGVPLDLVEVAKRRPPGAHAVAEGGQLLVRDLAQRALHAEVREVEVLLVDDRRDARVDLDDVLADELDVEEVLDRRARRRCGRRSASARGRRA